MEKTEICEKVIKDFNNKLLPGCKEALLVKFADSSSRRKKITGAWGAAAAAAAIAAGVDPRSVEDIVSWAGADVLEFAAGVVAKEKRIQNAPHISCTGCHWTTISFYKRTYYIGVQSLMYTQQGCCCCCCCCCLPGSLTRKVVVYDLASARGYTATTLGSCKVQLYFSF